MFSRIKNRATHTLLGIDFGSQSIKAVAVSRADGGFLLDAAACVSTPKGAIVEHQIVQPELIIEALDRLLKLLPGSYAHAATAVSGSHIITKIISMDANLSEVDLELQVQLEAENSIPFPLEEISLDFEVLGVNQTDATRSNVLLSAARTESISTRTDVLDASGLNLKIVDVESHALGRAWDYLLHQDEVQDDGVYGLFEIGANTLTFGVLNRGEVVYSRTQNFGCDLYDQRLATYYQIALEEAKSLKLAGELPAGHDIEVLSPFINELIQQLRKQIQLFLSSSGYRTIDGLYLSGGGTLLHDIGSHLEIELQQPVRIAAPFAHCDVAPSLDLEALKASGACYMVALGLALRRFDGVTY
jgi:type IV pilus assembly protein PilM